MTFAPGDVVTLKSGGQALTVIAADEDSVECVWIGEEGELFRETIPSVALTEAVPLDGDEEEHDDEDDEDEEDEEEETASSRKKSRAA